MLGKEVILRDLARVDLAADSTEEIFDLMERDFRKLGLVKDTYLSSIKKREAEYPTALPTEPYPIAIPHTMASEIIEPFIAPLRLKEPVPWGEMSDPSIKHPVKFVFMLGFRDPGDHIELLQILMYNFQKEEWMQKLVKASTADEFYEAVMEMEWTHD